MLDEFTHANKNPVAWPAALIPADLSLLESAGRWKSSAAQGWHMAAQNKVNLQTNASAL